MRILLIVQILFPTIYSIDKVKHLINFIIVFLNIKQPFPCQNQKWVILIQK